MPKLPFLVVAALLALTAAIATAATPSSGKVSKDAPSVEWTGTLAESAVAFNAINNNDATPCAPPACDTFALDVADGPANLELAVNLQSVGQDGTPADAGLRITDPDGKITWVSGPSEPDRAFKAVLKNAKSGAYTVDVVNSFIGSPSDYKAKATLLIPGASAVAPPTTNPPASPQEPGPAQPAAPAPTLTAKAGKASAKKLAKARKLVVKLTTTAPLTKLAAAMRKGSKVLGKGSLASLQSSGKITVKLPKKKLKPGSYKITVQGLDAQGRTVSAVASVKVGR
jgi:hypothetical protein